jgi:hypothetical protein
VRTILSAALVTSLVVVSCGGATSQTATVHAESLRLQPPSRSIQLRAAFDKDPSLYIGRFVPDSVAPADIDENAGVVTRCSKFIKPKVVETQQDLDETMFVSHRASASLGFPVFASIDAASAGRDEVRVRYSLTKKIQSDIDADGLDRCCKADPSQCSKTIIGEFVMGTGDVLQSANAANRVSTDVKTPKPMTAQADYRSTDGWKKQTSFNDVYFAFLTQPTPLAMGQVASAPNDCSWCDSVPGSLDGTYFCGVSPDAPDEAASRTLAMRSAREQVVQYLGQSISVTSVSTSNALAGALAEHEVVLAASAGIASQVKDTKWCKELTPTPDGVKVRSKVLAFYPKAAEDAGRTAVADAAIVVDLKSGKMTAQDAKKVRDAAKTK